MIVSPAFAGKRYAVLGLARSGMATVDTLLASGAEVTAWDSREEQTTPLEGRATIADPLTIDLSGFDGVVVSPGVPLNRHPIAAHARACGVPVIGDIELFAQARACLPPHKVVAITGTNGDGRQYRPAGARPAAAAGGRRLCAGAFELPDRPDLQP